MGPQSLDPCATVGPSPEVRACNVAFEQVHLARRFGASNLVKTPFSGTTNFGSQDHLFLRGSMLLPLHCFRMFRLAFSVVFLFAGLSSSYAQWEIQESHTTADLRGIANVGQGIAWASGTQGTVLRTEDPQLCL
jgi:hypothetical protein